MKVLQAAALYFAIVFAVGFLLGPMAYVVAGALAWLGFTASRWSARGK